jgi:hypothetical protein
MKITKGGQDTVGDMQRVAQSIPASYTVWKDGTQTIAESNIKGGTDYTTGTDSVVIQNAIDALTSGQIFLRNGIYSATVHIIDKPVTLRGESREGVILQHTGNVVGFANTAQQEWGGQGIYDLTIDGVDSTGYGLYMQYLHRGLSSRFNIKNCSTGLLVEGCISTSFDGFFIHTTGLGVTMIGNATMACNANQFRGGEIMALGVYPAAYFRAAGGDVSGNTFLGTTLEGSTDVMVNMASVAAKIPYGNRFIACWFETTHATPSFITEQLEGGATVYTRGNLYLGNKFAAEHNFSAIIMRGGNNRFIHNAFLPTGAATVGSIYAWSDDNLIEGNYLEDTTGHTLSIVDTGARNITKNNLNFVTENSGTSTGTGGEETIVHGCASTPTKITVTPTVTGTTVTNLFQEAGANHFHVTVTNLKTYNWKAEVL